jgi:hypothetical protein
MAGIECQPYREGRQHKALTRRCTAIHSGFLANQAASRAAETISAGFRAKLTAI